MGDFRDSQATPFGEGYDTPGKGGFCGRASLSARRTAQPRWPGMKQRRPQEGLPGANEADALLLELACAADAGVLSAAAPAATRFMQPVLQPCSTSGDTAALARVFAPFLVRLVKLAFGLLADWGTLCGDAELHAAAGLAEAGVAGLDALRSALRGRPREIEVQRYTLVRRLAARRLHARAAAQAELLHTAICSRWGCADTAAAGKGRSTPLGTVANGSAALRCLPRPGDTEAKEDVAVVIGTVLNLAACGAEGHPGGCSAAALLRLLPALDQLEPWLRQAVFHRLLQYNKLETHDALWSLAQYLLHCDEQVDASGYGAFIDTGSLHEAVLSMQRHMKFDACHLRPSKRVRRITCRAFNHTGSSHEAVLFIQSHMKFDDAFCVLPTK